MSAASQGRCRPGSSSPSPTRHRRGADPARRRAARPAGRRAVRARHRRGARGDAPVARARRAPATPGGCSSACSITRRRHDDPPDRPDRAARRRGDHRGVRRAGGRPDHLRLGRRGAGRSRGRLASSRRRSTRSSATRRATSRSSSSAARKDIKRIVVPGPRRPARRARAPLRRRDRARIGRDRRRSPPRPARASPSPSGPRPSARWPRSSSSTSRAAARRSLREAPNVRNAILREAERADLVVMGASAQPGGTDGETYLFGALPEAIAARAQAERHGRQDPRDDRADDLRAARGASRDAGRRRPRRRGGARRPGPRRALVRRIELPPRRVRRPPSPGRSSRRSRASRSALVLPTLNEEETIGPIVRRAMREMVGPGAAPRRDPRHRLGLDRPDPRDRRGRGRPGRPAPGRPAALRLVRRQGRGALEVALRGHRRHHRVGRHRREELAPADGLRDARAAPPRAAPAVRQGLLPAPDRRGRRAQGGRRRARHRARRAAADQPVLPRAVGDDPAAFRGVRGAPRPPRVDPVLHRLRGRDRAPDRRHRAGRDRGPRPGRPRAADPPQPGARGPVADVVRDPPGRHEAARGAAQDAAVRRDGLDDEAAAVRPRAAVARGHRAGRPGATADDPDPRVPRAAASLDGSTARAPRPRRAERAGLRPTSDPPGGDRRPRGGPPSTAARHSPSSSRRIRSRAR